MNGILNEAGAILVIDDDWVARRQLIDLLRGAGYRVLQADSGEAALTCLDTEHEIRVVITDIVLGGLLSGLDTVEALRTKIPTLGVIYTSHYLSLQSRIVDGGLFFSKPYRATEILDAIKLAQRSF